MDKKEAHASRARGGRGGGMPLDPDMSMALDVASSPSSSSSPIAHKVQIE